MTPWENARGFFFSSRLEDADLEYGFHSALPS